MDDVSSRRIYDTCSGCFLCGPDFDLQILTRSEFQMRSSRIKTVLGEAIGFFFRETRRMRCTGRRTQTSEPTLTVSGLAA